MKYTTINIYSDGHDKAIMIGDEVESPHGIGIIKKLHDGFVTVGYQGERDGMFPVGVIVFLSRSKNEAAAEKEG